VLCGVLIVLLLWMWRALITLTNCSSSYILCCCGYSAFLFKSNDLKLRILFLNHAVCKWLIYLLAKHNRYSRWNLTKLTICGNWK
jgi:hypothetical protein